MLSAVGGAVRVGADDLFIIGTPDIDFQAMRGVLAGGVDNMFG